MFHDLSRFENRSGLKAMGSNLLSVSRTFGEGLFLSGWLGQNPDAVLITDRAGVIEYVNPAFEELTGYARAEVLGRKPSILKSGVHDAEFYRRLWQDLLAGNPFRAVFVNRRKTGELYHAENLIWPFRGEDGIIVGFVCQTRDVTERVHSIEKLAHAASHDPLTDLPNRTLFLDRLGQALRQAARRNETVAVGVMDIDRFRDTNNRFGHPAGDAVLQTVARRSRGCLRETDTVARIGGDELALLLPDANTNAPTVLEKVRAANAAPIEFDGRLIRVSVSIGACMYPDDARDAEELHKRADGAMYEAKHAGGNQVHFYRDR
jgi:diguanylate cyclase (GGDEF)-like protein/PAS domain S-box-containing protein